MSRENIQKMFEKIQQDTAFRKQYQKHVGAGQNLSQNEAMKIVVEFGKAAGFEFSIEEITATQSELMDKKNENRELSDDQLDKVAGGQLFSLLTICRCEY